MYNKLVFLEKARKLRTEGRTFSEIQNVLGLKIPKSTLSYWFKDIEMSVEYRRKISKINYLSLRKAQESWAQKIRDERIKSESILKSKNLHLIYKIDIDVAKIILATLYLAEGAKRHGALQLGSSDVGIIRIFLKLLKKCYQISIDDIRCRISYRSDQDINFLTDYWSKNTGVPTANFYKTIPDPRTIGIKTKRGDYNGVCVVYILKSSKIHQELSVISHILIEGL